MQAAKTAFVTIRTAELTNKMQVEPYLVVNQGLYLCRDFHCFDYFCKSGQAQ